MLAPLLIKTLTRSSSNVLRRESLCLCGRLRSEVSEPLKPFMCLQRQSYRVSKRVFPYRDNRRREIEEDPTELGPESVELNTENNVARFSLGGRNSGIRGRRVKMSKKAKVKELKFFRLLARRKMRSPNPAVRIQYKIAKAKRKETWLIEKLRKFDIPKGPAEKHDPEILTMEEKHFLKRTGEKKKHYVPLGRRGVFGGVVLNMHLHWKNHQTVKVVCRPCEPGQIHEYADELARLSKGIVIDIKSDRTILFFRGKNYVQPEVMSPDTITKAKAMERYKYVQSLDHTSKFIERLEKEFKEFNDHVAKFKQGRLSEGAQKRSLLS